MDAIVHAIRQEDGVTLRRLLAHDQLNAAVASGRFGGQDMAQAAGRGLGNIPAVSDWVEFLDNYLLAFRLGASMSASMGAGQGGGQGKRQPYDALLSALTPFLKLFREDEGDWLVQPMHSVVHTLYLVAGRADADEAPNNPGKKLAALDIVNVSFKIYFRLNTLRLCKNLIRTVESRQFQQFESFPTAQKVTYKFYEGRLAVFDEHYEEAQEALTYALTHCHAGAKKNIARILKYLVPVGLLLGRLPSQSLVKEYSSVLSPYLPIADAIRTGNVGAFYEAMQAQRNRLVKDGTLLLLEKLQASVYRRLLRRVYVIHAQMEPGKAAQIPLVMYERALQVAGASLDMSEIECIVANLIVRKYVKGYISHKLKVLVVHKTQPFPSLDSVVLVDE